MNKLCLILCLVAICGLSAQVSPLPIQSYDYHTPENNVSPVSIGVGGLNLTNSSDFFGSYDNPALLANSGAASLAISYRLKNADQMNFYQAMQISNALKDKQFKYFSLVTKNAAWAYQPVAGIHLSEWNATGDTTQYYDYQLDKWQASYGLNDQDNKALSAGVNIKYLTGRLVYLKERKVGVSLIREAFIDDKIKGFSADLGFAYTQDSYSIGAAVYDVFSRLYWENYDSKQLTRRAAAGFQINNGSLSLLGGIQGKISSDPETTYHFGVVQDWNFDSQSFTNDTETSQNLILRIGMYSHDFYGTENINYTFGSGYNYNMFRVDFGMTNQGMKLRDSEFLFSIGVGLQ